jgi:hypothetical protein
VRIHRVANVRQRAEHHFRVMLYWPLSSGTGSGETDQAAFDAAVDLLLTRVAGLPFDKTHGARFLSVAENPAWITVTFEPAERAVESGYFAAMLTYVADDFETID